MKRAYTQPFIVVRAFIEQGGKFLLVQENWGRVKGLWNFPAGWLDLGEDPLRAVIREAKEETGYDFLPEALLGIYSYTKSEGGVLKHPLDLVFCGKVKGQPGEVDKAEISQVEWFAPEVILDMNKATLRDEITKQMVKDHLAGQKFPLSAVIHKSG